nr:MAG TPA: hypothetical protein [Microviridae sp.]
MPTVSSVLLSRTSSLFRHTFSVLEHSLVFTPIYPVIRFVLHHFILDHGNADHNCAHCPSVDNVHHCCY